MVCPAPPGSRKGNRVTAERWRRLLRNEGHTVIIGNDWQGEACDVLLGLHARKSFLAVRRYRREHPRGPLIVALTGTDLYHDLPRSRRAQQSIGWADRLIGLHALFAQDLPTEVRSKARVILQSAAPVEPKPVRSKHTFDVCVLGHLRHEKDPLRAAMALRWLPDLDSVRIIQAGQALTPRYARLADAARRLDARYRWLGEIPRPRALQLLASSRLMVISSRLEGGANVVSEAIVNGVPILASRIAGNIGLLGSDYGGYFDVGNTRALADLLARAHGDPRYYRELQHSVTSLAPRFRAEQEQASLAALLRELTSGA